MDNQRKPVAPQRAHLELYERCTESQLDIVQDLISRCDKAMDVRTKEHSFSPYRYHEYTRDVAEARREKETEAAREKRDEGSATGADSAKFKGATQAKGPRPAPPIMGLKRQNKPDWGSEKIEAPKSGNASSDLWLGRPGSMRGSYDGSGGVGSGGYKSVGLVSGPGEPSKVGLHMVTASPVSTEEKGLNLKTPVASKESKRKGREVTEKSAGAIRDFLKLHCMRTRNDEETVDFLYGRNQGICLLPPRANHTPS